MKNMKLLSLIIMLALLSTHAGALAATEVEVKSLHPMPRLALRYEFSPLTVYPPIVIFTAKLNFVPWVLSTPQPVVEFYSRTTSVCEAAETTAVDCLTGKIYLGSAPLDENGQAIFAKPFYPGKYSVIAMIRINSLTVWSNEVNFAIGQ